MFRKTDFSNIKAGYLVESMEGWKGNAVTGNEHIQNSVMVINTCGK